MNFMICLSSQRVENKKRGCFHGGAPKRVNYYNLNVPMIVIDMKREKQYIFQETISNSCMPLPDRVQSVSLSIIFLVSDLQLNSILLDSHFL